jgi:integrase
MAWEFDPMLDKRYQHTGMGRDVVDFLAWLELGGAADRTLDQYERDLSRACLMYPAKTLAEFSDDDMAQVAKTFKPASRRVRVAAYKSFFKWAAGTRRITLRPTDALPVIRRAPKRVYDLFTGPDILALCELPVRDGALFQLMFDTGARKGDCRTVRLRDWRQDATPDAPYGTIVFREGKGGKDRKVPITPTLARKLLELQVLEGVNPSDYLWYTRPGGGTVIARERMIGNGSFTLWWRNNLDAAGVRYRNPHMTRHTMATRFLSNKRGRLETLQLILGHESIQTTSDLYGHLDMRDVAYDMGLIEG